MKKFITALRDVFTKTLNVSIETLDDLLLRIDNSFNSKIGKNKYLLLARLNNPLPCILLLAPIYWVIIMGQKDVMANIAIFTLGAICLRTSGCIVNDIFDRKIDAKCERTKNRPIAAGKISVKAALFCLFVLLVFSASLLFLLPKKSAIFALLSLPLIAIYPLSKRVTNLPQVVLGITFNFGVFSAWFTQFEQLSFEVFLIYISAITWTIGYDSFYGHQDIEDDRKINIGSTPLLFKSGLNRFVWTCYKLSACCIAVLGLLNHFNRYFFILIAIAVYTLYLQVEDWRYEDVKLSKTLFRRNIIFAFIAILAFYVAR